VSLTVPCELLLGYSDHERRKWRDWIAADPGRLEIAIQPGGRFPTLGALLDHIFFAERRHLSRLEGGTPPEATGVPPGDWEALFEYAGYVRADLHRYVEDIDDRAGDQILSFSGPFGAFALPRRRLVLHILLHEVRHLAQAALAARVAGVAPPGEHDILYYSEPT
jgi:uncharacterized damage-inducible protein DinB